MKCSAILTLALAAVAVASPMPITGRGRGRGHVKGDSSTGKNATATATATAMANGTTTQQQQQVTAAIDAWLRDIQAVNTFVDTAGALGADQPQAVSDAAATALVAAKDEGTQNDALAALVALDASGRAAAADLANQFGIIGPAIEDTVANPQNVQKNLDAINGARYVSLLVLLFFFLFFLSFLFFFFALL